MTRRTTRRTFIRHIGYGGAALPLIMPPLLRAASANGKLNIGGIGVGGKGWGDINSVSENQNVVAICDVEQGKTNRKGGFGAAVERWSEARRYQDWRKLLDEGKDIDGVTVSTPDHMHAPIAVSAMLLGKHVYVQKPMAHDVYEARQMRLIARRQGVVTQMGNQHHSGIPYRMLVQMIQDGALGKIKEAHAWSNRPIWPQGIDRPAGSDPVPETLAWDLWIGTAPMRPFVKDVYHPFKWRGWLDFGTGAQGDMACHIMDPVVWSLGLGAPNVLWSESPTPNKETYPEWSTIHYEFDGTQFTAGDKIHVTWYDGGKMPPKELAMLPAERELPKNGTLFIGEKGVALTSHGSGPELLPRENFADYERPKLEGRNHYMQWTNACKGQDKTTSHFDYAGPLTETVLLGNIALRFPGQKLEWDPKALKITNEPKANDHLRRTYRAGWEVSGLV